MSRICFCLYLPPLLCQGACCPEEDCLSLERHFTFQCPVFPHAQHWVSLAGQEEHPGALCLVQFPQECCCCCFCPCPCLCPFPWPFFGGPLHMVWTSLELPRPMASISPLMAMWVLHVSNILAVVTVISIARSFFTSSQLSRAQTRRYCTFRSFSSSEGKLHRSARARRRSTSSSGDSPGRILISSSL